MQGGARKRGREGEIERREREKGRNKERERDTERGKSSRYTIHAANVAGWVIHRGRGPARPLRESRSWNSSLGYKTCSDTLN